jgi:DNA polymerase III epsilon subunit-like protein
MKKPLAFIDVETTGLNSQLHEIIEISIIRVCPKKGMTNYTSKIKPVHIEYAEPRALAINGYNEKDWFHAPDAEQVMSRVADLTSGCILVGHNVRFDEEFLSETCFRNGIKTRYDRRMIDTVTLALEHLHNLKSVSMDSIREYFDWKEGHRARIDVLQTYMLYKKLNRATVFHRLYWRVRYLLRSLFP